MRVHDDEEIVPASVIPTASRGVQRGNMSGGSRPVQQTGQFEAGILSPTIQINTVAGDKHEIERLIRDKVIPTLEQVAHSRGMQLFAPKSTR